MPRFRDSKIHLLIILLIILVGQACGKKPATVDQKSDPAARNILIITIDTLRPDALSVYGGKTITPFFESFAKNALVFEKAYTTAPITLPAHTSLFTGLTPPSHGVRHNGVFRASPELPLLAKIAKKNGLRTAAIVAAFPLASQFGLNTGFDYYDDRFAPLTAAPGVFAYAERNAEQVRLAAEEWLRANKNAPYFLWVHFFDPHHPYLEHGQPGISPYQQEVNYVDHQLKLLFDAIRFGNDTLIVLTADHGEAFGEHREFSHSLFVYNTTLRIPLLIRASGVKPGRHTQPVGIIDVVPTVLELMQWQPEAKLDGVSVVRKNPESNRLQYAETMATSIDFGWSSLFTVQDSRFKYIAAPRAEFYDLQNDPNENKNLFPGADVTKYKKEVERFQKVSETRNSKYQPSSEEREKLQALGYASGGADAGRTDPKDKVEVAREIARLTLDPAPLAEKAGSYEKLMRQDPENPIILLRFGEVLLQQGKHSRAETLFKKALTTSPSPSAYNGLAAALFYQEKNQEAELVLKEAVTKGFADGETYYNLAEFRWSHGDQKTAFGLYNKSKHLRYKEAFFRIARLHAVMNLYQDAFAVMKEAEEAFPFDASVDFQKGMLYSRMGNHQQAAQSFETALAKDPVAWEIHYNLGVTYYRLGNKERSAAALKECLRLAPQSAKEERQHAVNLLAS